MPATASSRETNLKKPTMKQNPALLLGSRLSANVAISQKGIEGHLMVLRRPLSGKVQKLGLAGLTPSPCHNIKDKCCYDLCSTLDGVSRSDELVNLGDLNCPNWLRLSSVELEAVRATVCFS